MLTSLRPGSEDEGAFGYLGMNLIISIYSKLSQQITILLQRLSDFQSVPVGELGKTSCLEPLAKGTYCHRVAEQSHTAYTVKKNPGKTPCIHWVPRGSRHAKGIIL